MSIISYAGGVQFGDEDAAFGAPRGESGNGLGRRGPDQGVAAVLAAKPADEPPTDEKPPREPKPDASRPLPGTPAAAALEALDATQVLRGIVDRPNALALSVGRGAFPAVDVPREIAVADGWLVANPANAKKNGARFLANWLRKAQERAPRVDPQRSGAFTLPQRATDPVDPVLADIEAKRAEWARRMAEKQAAAKGAA